MHGAPTTEDTSHGDTDTKTADKIGTDNVFAAASRSRFRSEHVARGIQQITLLQANVFSRGILLPQPPNNQPRSPAPEMLKNDENVQNPPFVHNDLDLKVQNAAFPPHCRA